MTCDECGRDFAPDDDEVEVCPTCQRDWLRENVPEAFPYYYSAGEDEEG